VATKSNNPAKHWLEKIHQLPQPSQTIKIMNVCGGHERSIMNAGLRKLLPSYVELIPGPGCPVCICPEEDIYLAIQLALNEDIILVAFGDMLRVPVNVKKSEVRTLQQAKAEGAKIYPIASPTEVVQIAKKNPQTPIVFFAAGFETTTTPVVAMLAEGTPDNVFMLLSGRLTSPAVALLLDSGEAGFDGLVAPGHVATVMGTEEWKFIIEKHQLPTAVAGFSAESLLAAFYSVLRQKQQHKLFLDNCYPEVAKSTGNLTAQKILKQVVDVVDAKWRGIGIIKKSGFALNKDYQHKDVLQHFKDYQDNKRSRVGEMPAGCDCASVVLGKKYPNQCKLYGLACTPKTPIGPCMVSDEGACHIWWAGGIHQQSP
jgi:hydrogenase expression/formation protein HypD